MTSNLRRMIQGLSQKELEILEDLVGEYRIIKRDTWIWEADGVWRKYSANSKNVLVEVSPGTDFATIPGRHWVWHFPGEKDYNLYQRNSYCPFKARAMADAALLERAKDLLDKAREIAAKADVLKKEAEKIKGDDNGKL